MSVVPSRVEPVTTALYRRYRPEDFAEVIGQEHVTAPLMQALRSGRVNHAYLFSGPRGCGKTTSARILARTLNCHANTPDTPIDTPCGTCPSCVELARGGSGSLDVVEIDAASHGGVDDARDLRERATFAPARDRYKIFIIDEAHMVSQAGFNALLKIVEEPPPHIKFVFATTEPDKVIGTIRSRTHHYPFRLVPPDVLGPYLESLCAAEHVTLGGGVVPLVVRAGGGSVRDSLSVLDQLIAGSSDGVVDYDLAVGLLGFTHASLLDDVVDALAADDGASLFRVVDQLIASGHAPQRFVDDLLERLRDLIVIAVSGDAAAAVLRGLPDDQLERMGQQSGRLGIARLSRAADLVNAAVSEMTGATSPRLHLELLCARLLLPGADEGAAGLAARVERLERGGLAAALPHTGRLPVGGSPLGGSPLGGSPSEGGSSPVVEPVETSPRGAAAARAALAATKRRATAAQPDAVQPDAAQPDLTMPVPVTPGPATSPAPVPPTAAVADAAAPAVSDVETSDAETSDAEPAAAESPVVEPPAAESPVVEPPAVGTVDAGVPGAEVSGAEGPGHDVPESSMNETTTELVRRRWPEVLGNIPIPGARAFLAEYAQVMDLTNGVLTLGFPSSVVTQARRGRPETITNAVYETLGVAVSLDIQPADAATAARPREPEARRRPHESVESDDPVPPPAVEAAPSARAESRNPDSSPATEEPVAFDEADAAWLAGAATYEPPPDDEPEPPEDVEPQPAPAPVQAPAPPVPPRGDDRTTLPEHQPPGQGAPAPAPTTQSAARPGLPRRETAVEAVQRHALQARGRGSVPQSMPSVSGPDPYDDAATDDPDIASTGLVGVPLAVKLLNGTIIDEQVDHT